MKVQTKHRAPVPPKAATTTNPALEATAELLLRKKAELARLENEVAGLRGHLVETLGVGVHDVGGFAVTVDERERLSFDQKAMVEAFGEKAMAPFAKLTRYVAVSVTPRAEDASE